MKTEDVRTGKEEERKKDQIMIKITIYLPPEKKEGISLVPYKRTLSETHQ